MILSKNNQRTLYEKLFIALCVLNHNVKFWFYNEWEVLYIYTDWNLSKQRDEQVFPRLDFIIYVGFLDEIDLKN